jgi:hypothetical protein
VSNPCDVQLDDFALTACQGYNLGNANNWFFSFRGGLHGLRSRLRGVEFHSHALHEWSLHASIADPEHHIATILFCMDSALECFVFMLNALGQASDVAAFRDVSNERALSAISPRDILGGPRSDTPRPGYATVFPGVAAIWKSHTELIRLITDNHDVTKHREQGFSGGRHRSDPPAGHFEALGIPEDSPLRILLAPMAEVLLPRNPKLPIETLPSDRREWVLLEDVESEFRKFFPEALCRAVGDATANIKLNDPTLH